MGQLAHAGIADLDDANATLEQFMAGLPSRVHFFPLDSYDVRLTVVQK